MRTPTFVKSAALGAAVTITAALSWATPASAMSGYPAGGYCAVYVNTTGIPGTIDSTGSYCQPTLGVNSYLDSLASGFPLGFPCDQPVVLYLNLVRADCGLLFD